MNQNHFSSLYKNRSYYLPRWYILDAVPADVEPNLDAWMLKTLQQPEHKQLPRAKLLVETYNTLLPDLVSNDFKAHLLGWIVEMVAWLVANDMRDFVETTGEHPIPVGTPIPDEILQDFIPFRLLRRYFGMHPVYQKLYDCLAEMVNMTASGNELEKSLVREAEDNLYDNFTAGKYEELIRLQTSFCNVTTPVKLGFILAGKANNAQLIRQVEEISGKVAYYFKIQYEYYNCFHDESLDIEPRAGRQDKKFTWLFATAARYFDSSWKRVLWRLHGINNFECVKLVRNIYKGLDVPELFKVHRDETEQNIRDLVIQLDNDIYKNAIFRVMHKLSCRIDF